MLFLSNIWLNHPFLHALDFPRKSNIIENFALQLSRWVLVNHNEIYFKKYENRYMAVPEIEYLRSNKRLNGTFGEREEIV